MGNFHAFMERSRSRHEVVFQPRMGFSDPAIMRRGLQAVRDTPAPTIGTLTLDSYTRTRAYDHLDRALAQGQALNGYPIVTLGPARTRALIEDIASDDFPIQVRHGTPRPQDIVRTMVAAGIQATEGGPISYCLPYSRVPLDDSLAAWAESCQLLCEAEAEGTISHLESFGGCMLGQLCPPAMLVAIAVLEGLFFERCGLRSVSLSYAQGSNSDQDVGAVQALADLAGEHLLHTSWHIVIYTFMGLFPRTADGARGLVEESARIAVRSGASRLIVKTAAEAHQIPDIDENVDAILWAHEAAATASEDPGDGRVSWHRDVIMAQARALIEAVLDEHPRLDRAIARAFGRGLLDIPFCLHPDNHNRVRAWVDDDGAIHWTEVGNLPLPQALRDTIFVRHQAASSSDRLVHVLSYNQRKYDCGGVP